MVDSDRTLMSPRDWEWDKSNTKLYSVKTATSGTFPDRQNSRYFAKVIFNVASNYFHINHMSMFTQSLIWAQMCYSNNI